MIQLVYVSREAVPFDARQLRALLEKSRTANLARGITGMLAYRNGSFLQVLEGEESEVRSLNEKIARDPRHSTIVVLHTAPIIRRDFPDWSMGFKDLSGEPELSGQSSFLDSSISLASFKADPPMAKRLLLSFKADALSVASAETA